MGMRFHTTGSVRKDLKVRSEKCRRVGIKSDTALRDVSPGVFEANGLPQICKDLPSHSRRSTSTAGRFWRDRQVVDGDESIGQAKILR